MSPTYSGADRVVVVQGGLQGSGVLLTPTLILTAAHVLGNRRSVRVIHPSESTWTDCEVLWRGDLVDPTGLPRQTAVDLAILRTRTWVGPRGIGRLRWGAINTTTPLADCQIIGFPAVQRQAGTQELELDQFEATVLPAVGRPRHTVVCEFSRPPATELPDGTSPLAGISGAPVFAGPVLLGIVTQVPEGRGHFRIEAAPLDLIPLDQLATVDEQLPRTLEPVTDSLPNDERFEFQYLKAVKQRYRKIEIIGIEDLGDRDSRWDLDTAYLHLEAGAKARSSKRHNGQRPQRIDELLAGPERVVLLRGEAGAGKTTLVWWLASHAASGKLGGRLARFNGLVPFVIPLRSLHAQGESLPAPAAMPQVAQLMTENPPSGWALRALEAGRGWLMVDGLDEVPLPDRERAKVWLREVLESFREIQCMVTTRPLAVEADWLGLDEDVLDLHVLPMRDPDIDVFVRAWHRAKQLEPSHSVEERAALGKLGEDLLRSLEKTPELRDLARTPLLCAVICALHHRRRGLLPTSRAALYRAALDMLLGSRDALRRIGNPEGVELDTEEHKLLLQRVAVWLVRNGQTQLSYAQAEGQLHLALLGMPRVSRQGTSRDILKHVLNRSGLLQERADDSVQFIHRTFQDYLAAKELRESDCLGEMLRYASEEAWWDVVLLAIGQCSRSEVATIIKGLLDQGDTASTSWSRWRLYVLAANCAANAIYLEENQRRDVDDRIKSLGPPTSTTEVVELAKLGPYVVPLLPGPEYLGEETQLLVLETLNRIGSPACLPAIRAFASERSQRVRQAIASAWTDFPIGSYASSVLAYTRLDDLEFVTDRRDLLDLMPSIGRVQRLKLLASGMRRADLAKISAIPALRELRITGLRQYLPDAHPGVARLSVDCANLDVEGLHEWIGLRSLALLQPASINALFIELARLPALQALQLPLASPVIALESVPVLPNLRALTLPELAEAGDLSQLARAFPGLRRLTLQTQPSTTHFIDLTALQYFPELVVRITYDDQPPTVVGRQFFGGRVQIAEADHGDP